MRVRHITLRCRVFTTLLRNSRDVLVFTVRNLGSTEVKLDDIKLLDPSGNEIPVAVKNSQVKIVAFEEYVDGEYQKLLKSYKTLTANYTELRVRYSELSSAYSNLTIKYRDTLEELHKCQSTLNTLNESYNNLSATYSNLLIKHQSVLEELDNYEIKIQRTK